MHWFLRSVQLSDHWNMAGTWHTSHMGLRLPFTSFGVSRGNPDIIRVCAAALHRQRYQCTPVSVAIDSHSRFRQAMRVTVNVENCCCVVSSHCCMQNTLTRIHQDQGMKISHIVDEHHVTIACFSELRELLTDQLIHLSIARVLFWGCKVVDLHHLTTHSGQS